MGKSDPIVFKWYLSHVRDKYENVAFLGFDGENNFSRLVNSDNRDFYDLSLGNWNINDRDWNIDKKYDAVICTRCAYFSKDPASFIKNCLDILNDRGHLLVDWGIGDHWRFSNYKVGWVKNGEHEHCYGSDNFLWSALWNKEFLRHSECKKFSSWVQKMGYDDLEQAIIDEVPSIIDPADIVSLFKSASVDILCLWKDSPQLYMLLNCTK